MQTADTEVVQRKKNQAIASVFQRNGKRITRIAKAWRPACIAAGCPGRIPHDLRRSAIRTMVRANIETDAVCRG